MKSRSFTVILHTEDDIYVAECPEVGTVDQRRNDQTSARGFERGNAALLRGVSPT